MVGVLGSSSDTIWTMLAGNRTSHSHDQETKAPKSINAPFGCTRPRKSGNKLQHPQNSAAEAAATC
jgi:hypothetical protein